MCICFYTTEHPVYSLVLATNRDEFLSRPTLAAHWHGKDNATLCGIDVTGGGTWFGIEKKTGKFGLLTNVREEVSSKSRSRGKLVTDWLESPQQVSVHSHMETLRSSMAEYAGFNLLLGQILLDGTVTLASVSNRSEHLKQAEEDNVECGRNVHDSQPSGVISNGALTCGLDSISTSNVNKAWPKMETGRQAFQKLLQSVPTEAGQMQAEQDLVDGLLDVLNIAPVTINDKEDVRSAVLVTAFDMFPSKKAWYATRAQSILLVKRDTGECIFVERQAYELHDGQPRWNGRQEEWRFGIGTG